MDPTVTPNACPATTMPGVTYAYDSHVSDLLGVASAPGQRTMMSDASGSTRWFYDSRGRLMQEEKTVSGTGGGTFKSAWGYDAADRPVTMQYPADNMGGLGETVTTSYDPATGQITGLSGSNLYASALSYTPYGQLKSLAFNGNVQSYTYNPLTQSTGAGLLATSTLSLGPRTLSYTYDKGGNVRTINYVQGSPAVESQAQTFEYDERDRLTRAWTTGSTSGQYNESYQYDTIGNLKRRDATAPQTSALVYSYAAQATSACESAPLRPHTVTATGSHLYCYDANGSLIKRRTTTTGTERTLTYDVEGRLAAIAGDVQASFVYDGDGARIKKSEGDITTVYIGAHYERSTGAQPLAVPDESFEGGTGWSTTEGQASTTAIYRTTCCTALPHTGSYAQAISNLAYGYLQSDLIPVEPGTVYNLHAYLRGQLDGDTGSAGSWIIRARFYDANDSYLSVLNAQKGGVSTVTTAWQQQGGTLTTPAGAVKARIELFNIYSDGWLAFDDVSFIKAGSTTNLAPNPSFQTSSGWTALRALGAPTNIYRPTGGTGLGQGRTDSSLYVISNQMAARLRTTKTILVTGGQSYDLSAYLRGQGDPDTGAYGTWAVRATFYNSAGSAVGTLDAASGTLASLTPSWTRQGGAIVAPATATTAVVELASMTGSGWVAFDSISMMATGSGGGSSLSAPSTQSLTTSDAPTASNLEPTGELISDPSFEEGAGWSAVVDLPDATNGRRYGSGNGQPHAGSYSYVISNQAYGSLLSDPIAAEPQTVYDVHA